MDTLDPLAGFVTTAQIPRDKSSIDFSLLEEPLPQHEGLIAVGGKLNPGTLYQAYSYGVFPWPTEDSPMLWFCPEERGILFLDEYSPPRRFLQWKKQNAFKYKLTWNQNFEAVIKACQKQQRPGQVGTWIRSDVLRAYLDFHRAGFAQSVECWRDGKLVGGLYGVYVQGVFSGESMFHAESGTSKLCLDFVMGALKKLGSSWMDTQMVTSVLGQFGARSIKRHEYLQLLAQVQREGAVKS